MPARPHGDEAKETGELQQVEGLLEFLLEQDGRLDVYPDLAHRDPRIAELYRQALTEPERLDPVQAAVDEEGQVWINIFAKAAEGVEPEMLREFMDVRASFGGVAVGRVSAHDLPELLGHTQRLEAARPPFDLPATVP